MSFKDIFAKLYALDLPPPGTPVADLTDSQQLSLARAAGAEVKLFIEHGRAGLRTTCLVGITDDGNGKYIVAIGPKIGD